MDTRGVVVVGYQGVGKSTLANERSKFIDLESSNFRVGGERIDNWYTIYCKIALSLALQGKIVFVSSHKEVREYLNSNLVDGVKLACCVPSIDLEDFWIQKLSERFERTGLDKDFRALMNAKDRYKMNIFEIMNNFECRCVIHTPDYKLYDVLFDVFRLQPWYNESLESVC